MLNFLIIVSLTTELYKMTLIVNVLLVVLVASFASCADDFPSFVERCRNDDNECMINAWNKYLRQAGGVNGIPELVVPNLHDYFAEKAVINAGGDAVTLKLTLLNSTLSGLDGVTFTKITGFPKDPKAMSKFELSGFAPKLMTKGNYKASGKVLLFPLSGDGYAELQFFNCTFKVTVETSTEVKDGEEYLVISNVRTNYKSERNSYRFDNLLNNKELSDSINDIFNNNQDIINKELSGPMAIAISRIFKKIFIPIFGRYPYHKFFL